MDELELKITERARLFKIRCEKEFYADMEDKYENSAIPAQFAKEIINLITGEEKENV